MNGTKPYTNRKTSDISRRLAVILSNSANKSTNPPQTISEREKKNDIVGVTSSSALPAQAETYLGGGQGRLGPRAEKF